MKSILSEYLRLWKNDYLSCLCLAHIYTGLSGEKSSVQAFLCALCWLVAPSPASVAMGALVFQTGLLVCVCKCEVGLDKVVL